MKELLAYLITGIVSYKSDVMIRKEESDTTVTFFVAVNAEDLGQVIGKEECVINAIRDIINTASRGSDTTYLVEIEEYAHN